MFSQKDLLRIFCKFRFQSHKLKISKLRYDSAVDTDELLCSNCTMHAIEDEYHFLLVCPYYKHLRELLIPEYYFVSPSREKLYQLLTSNNPKYIKKTVHILEKKSPSVNCHAPYWAVLYVLLATRPRHRINLSLVTCHTLASIMEDWPENYVSWICQHPI